MLLYSGLEGHGLNLENVGGNMAMISRPGRVGTVISCVSSFAGGIQNANSPPSIIVPATKTNVLFPMARRLSSRGGAQTLDPSRASTPILSRPGNRSEAGKGRRVTAHLCSLVLAFRTYDRFSLSQDPQAITHAIRRIAYDTVKEVLRASGPRQSLPGADDTQRTSQLVVRSAANMLHVGQASEERCSKFPSVLSPLSTHKA